ncbi:MAG TPA: hypothetical protein VHB21_15690, partial [Minicystis sp.]|nr:hypothetical protein [Minicystis sp.]
GLTVVDLSDAWTPRVFAKDPATGDASPYRARYLRLANQRDTDLGLFGIQPSLTRLAERLTDEKRQRCQAAVDRAPIEALHAAMDAAPEGKKAALAKAYDARPAIRAVEAQLVCDRLLLPTQANGTLGKNAQIGLEIFRRRHMIVAISGLDPDAVAALALPGDELDFRALLRGLRERVAEAAGLVEDGSASGDRALVVGRTLDLSPFAALGQLRPLDGAAKDLVDVATDAAARALGWTSPEAARDFAAARGRRGFETLRVALRLPPPPAYLAREMELRVEIDRGDVFYDTPLRAAIERKRLGKVRAPSFVLYAKDHGKDRALVRWATTIGGWQKERVEEGQVVLRYKESDVGQRFWRHLVAAPAWLPPDSTPEAELVREGDDGTLALKKDLIEPGYLNAYGLVMLVHDERVEDDDGGDAKWEDHGIRTHGSVNYKSILRGESHGCHRLYNHLALRLSGYLLAHRRWVRRGKLHSTFHRTLSWHDQKIDLDVPIRGYLFELDPPVPVDVLEGNIVGEEKTPVTSLIRLKKDPASG